MRSPDFFIVGAPKCGTTALYSYLADHPAVYMPEVKEPHFFATDLTDYTWITERRAYEGLFEGASPGHEAVGEASVFYLYSEVAAQGIREEFPRARLIVMVRKPIEMFLSLHNQMLATLWEDEEDPERAWRLQGRRLVGESLPRHCEDPRKLQYGPICSLGRQLERLMGVFPEDQVHVVLFDDFARDTAETYAGVVAFLGLQQDQGSRFARVNAAHRSRWPFLAHVHRSIDRFLRSLPEGSRFRRALGPLRPLSRALRGKNVRRADKGAVSPEFRGELEAYFSKDIDLLERLVGRDLTAWRG